MALLDHDEQDLKALPLRQGFRPPPPEPDDRLQPGNDNRLAPHQLSPELDCLIGILPAKMLRDAAVRARTLNTGADRVLIASGAIDDISYLEHFARHTGITIETFGPDFPSHVALLRDDQMRYAAQSGLLPVRLGDATIFVIAPRHLTARNLMRALAEDPNMAAQFRIATAEDFDAYVLHRSNGALAHDAAFLLRDRMPALSAAPRRLEHPRKTQCGRIATSVALAGLLSLPPDFAIGFWSQCLALWFVAAIGLRLTAAMMPQRPPPRWRPLPDGELPMYSVIVALYREARSVSQLLGALDALDYPREKLDIILAVEADDLATRTAIARFGAMPHLRVMVAPNLGPRTKPKALNAVLPFARGEFIAVFDAEDRPDPGQLRAALDVFRTGGNDIACAQASLCILNVSDSLFTRMFAAEYAGQFDAVLPGLATMKLPLPLGGTSNHFRAIR